MNYLFSRRLLLEYYSHIRKSYPRIITKEMYSERISFAYIQIVYAMRVFLYVIRLEGCAVPKYAFVAKFSQWNRLMCVTLIAITPHNKCVCLFNSICLISKVLEKSNRISRNYTISIQIAIKELTKRRQYLNNLILIKTSKLSNITLAMRELSHE